MSPWALQVVVDTVGWDTVSFSMSLDTVDEKNYRHALPCGGRSRSMRCRDTASSC